MSNSERLSVETHQHDAWHTEIIEYQLPINYFIFSLLLFLFCRHINLGSDSNSTCDASFVQFH